MAQITENDIIGPWRNHQDLTDEIIANIEKLADCANNLIMLAEADGLVFKKNPVTRTLVSGETLGGFRPRSATIGAARSNHKLGLAVDIFDPKNIIDEWCMRNLDKLADCGIYIEHPSATNSWSHWQCVPPKSGRRVFNP